MPQTEVPASWKLSKAIRDELPESEKADAAKHLWARSDGLCALCNEALPADGKRVEADHIIARESGTGGETVLKNLHLAHKTCNASRKNLEVSLAKRIIRFVNWSKASAPCTFNKVVAKYVPERNQSVAYEITGDEIMVSFGQIKRHASLATDPATGTRYFFMSTPVGYIMNDEQTQPRLIEFDHVRTLAEDFAKRPVHEPSNCRFVTRSTGVADLLQFDGQHKTTAQLVLGRDEVPMKFYMNPDEAMLQELVVQIQQGIKKRPLSTSDTLRKLDDVVRGKVEEYRKANNGEYPTEARLVAAQPKEEQREFKKRLLTNLEYAVLNDPEFRLQAHASKKADKQSPFTDTVLVNKLIKPLISQELVTDETMDQSLARETERRAVINILNRVDSEMLENKWAPASSDEDIDTRRARNFFYQGAIGFWMGTLLIPAIRFRLNSTKHQKMFWEELKDDESEIIDALVDTLCTWDIWSTSVDTQLAALRSNTVSNVAAAFSHITVAKLMQDATGSLTG